MITFTEKELLKACNISATSLDGPGFTIYGVEYEDRNEISYILQLVHYENIEYGKWPFKTVTSKAEFFNIGNFTLESGVYTLVINEDFSDLEQKITEFLEEMKSNLNEIFEQENQLKISNDLVYKEKVKKIIEIYK